jgi:hypothetical protein
VVFGRAPWHRSRPISSFFHDRIITPKIPGCIVNPSPDCEVEAMHVQIVEFQLNGIDDAQYRAACDEGAPTFAAIPGLLSKIWLADQSSNTYGGVYIWRDRQSMQNFVGSDLFRGITDDPQLNDVRSHDFEVLETPTEVTHGATPARV